MSPSCRGAVLLAACSFLLVAGCHTPESQREGMKVSMPGPGVVLKRGATTYFGSPYNCSRPGAIDLAQVQAATPEWQTITQDRVRRGSARFQLLHRQMHDRIVAAIAQVAKARELDLVVQAGDITDSRGMTVTDITLEVERDLDPAAKSSLPAGISGLTRTPTPGSLFRPQITHNHPSPSQPRTAPPTRSGNP